MFIDVYFAMFEKNLNKYAFIGERTDKEIITDIENKFIYCKEQINTLFLNFENAYKSIAMRNVQLLIKIVFKFG